MRRGTTPTITINVTGETFDNSTMYVTIEQSTLQITKTGDDIEVYPTEDGCTVALFLTQEETLKFAQGSARLQIRWITSDGVAQASPIKNISVDPILLEGVIEYDN